MSDRAKALHDSPWRGVFIVTGGGSGFLSEILTTPGASRTVIHAEIPYSEEAMIGALGFEPEKSCSMDTASSMAQSAYDTAIEYDQGTTDEVHLFGFGSTAALATDRERRGSDRICIALHTKHERRVWHLHPFDIRGDREWQEGRAVETMWRVLQHLRYDR